MYTGLPDPLGTYTSVTSLLEICIRVTLSVVGLAGWPQVGHCYSVALLPRFSHVVIVAIVLGAGAGLRALGQLSAAWDRSGIRFGECGSPPLIISPIGC